MSTEAQRFEANLAELLSTAHEVFLGRFPGQNFGSATWDMRHLNYRASRLNNGCLHFTDEADRQLPASFVLPLKAHLALACRSTAHLATTFYAHRYLWRSIRDRYVDQEDSFRWWHLTEADLLTAETLMLETLAPSTTYKRCMRLKATTDFLAQRDVMAPLSVAFVTPRPGGSTVLVGDRHSPQDPRMPDEYLLKAIVSIYRSARNEQDELLVSSLLLMLATGLRIGEVLALLRDCLIDEQRNGKPTYGVRFHKEKGKKHVTEVRWLTPEQAEIALPVLQRVLAITATAAERAAEIETNPSAPPIPGYSPTDLIPGPTVGEILNCDYQKLNLQPHSSSTKHRHFFLALELQAWLAKKQKSNWILRIDSGRSIPLSRALFVVHQSSFGARSVRENLLVRPVHQDDVRRFISPKRYRRPSTGRLSYRPSVFARYGFLPEGEEDTPAFHSHMLRHWVNTNAERGGADQTLLNLWNRREHSGEAEAYSHLTPTEQMARVRQLFEQGTGQGTRVAIYKDLVSQNEDAAEQYLESSTRAVLRTPFGLCLHDYRIEPCPYHLNCLTGDGAGGCRDYVHDPQDEQQTRELKRLLKATEDALAQVSAREEQGEAVADGWKRNTSYLRENIMQILDGSHSQQPLRGKSQFIPLEEIDDFTQK